MGVKDDERRLFEGRPHEWRVPPSSRRLPFLMFLVAVWILGLELFFVVGELLLNGVVLPETARAFALAGILCLVLGNLKTIALALRGASNEALEGLVGVALKRLWVVHFWMNPVGLISLGLFLLFAPRAQPPFYYIAYGVLLWQAVGGLLGREALPVPTGRAELGRTARAAHRQPAVFVLLAVLVAAGFVQSLFT